jgi:hypothetical protein
MVASGSEGSARTRLAQLWDAEIRRFLNGEPTPSPELQPWCDSYSGTGEGAVDLEAFPEPFLGPLMGSPKVAFLALNPGIAYPEFQYRPDGVFVKELERERYTDWAARWRYLDEERPRVEGGLRFHRKRRSFMRNWFDDQSLDRSDMLSFELYPWHSKMLSDSLKPDLATVSEFILEPIAEAGIRHTFAFGADWIRVLDGLGLDRIVTLGAGGEPYRSSVESRTFVMFKGSGDNLILVGKQQGSAGPPSPTETKILRQELEARGLV